MLFIRSIEIEKGFKKILFYCGGLVLFTLSLGSKETAISLPFVLLFYDYYFFERRPLIKRLVTSGIFIIGATVVELVQRIFNLAGRDAQPEMIGGHVCSAMGDCR